MQPAPTDRTLELGILVRMAAPALTVIAMLAALRWLALPLAAYVVPTRIPAVLPLLVGALMEPLRLVLLLRLRRSLRRKCLTEFAAASLDAAPSRQNEGAGPWRAAHVAERAVAVELSAVLAGLLTTASLLALSISRLGVSVVGAFGALLALGALLGWVAARQRRPLYQRLVTAMQRVGAWMAAAHADRGEIRAPLARARFLQSLGCASDEWSQAEARVERRRLVTRAVLALVALAALGVAVIRLGSGIDWLWLDRLAHAALGGLVDLIVLASLVPSVLMLARNAEAFHGSRNELLELRPRPAPSAAPYQPLSERPKHLVVRALAHRYGDVLGVSAEALDVDLEGPLVLVGRNGSGKSTLASLIAGVFSPSSGTVELDGVACHRLDPDAIAFVPQEPVIIGALTVAENVRLVAPLASDEAISETLASLGLTVELDHPSAELSRGECRRIALCRALLKGARLIVLDEPDAWLDSQGRTRLLALLEQLRRTAAVVLVTHRAEIAGAASMAIVLGFDKRPESAGALEHVAEHSRLYRQVVGAGAS